ncbi:MULTISPECIES: hypothetical protein [Curtobacterium]|uniref:hypothetical protein n=1 Tax=Curtobacterium flaccumfaciens TaxID=2035 RepID=UPI003EE7CEAB
MILDAARRSTTAATTLTGTITMPQPIQRDARGSWTPGTVSATTANAADEPEGDRAHQPDPAGEDRGGERTRDADTSEPDPEHHDRERADQLRQWRPPPLDRTDRRPPEPPRLDPRSRVLVSGLHPAILLATGARALSF